MDVKKLKSTIYLLFAIVKVALCKIKTNIWVEVWFGQHWSLFGRVYKVMRHTLCLGVLTKPIGGLKTKKQIIHHKKLHFISFWWKSMPNLVMPKPFKNASKLLGHNLKFWKATWSMSFWDSYQVPCKMLDHLHIIWISTNYLIGEKWPLLLLPSIAIKQITSILGSWNVGKTWKSIKYISIS